ncbi:MAG: hybrid sensor histidine kinase/response regulator, partial [Janthinobacterium lividum]
LIGQRRLQDLLTMGGRVFHQTHWAPLLQIQGSVAEVKLAMTHRDGHAVPMLLNAIRRRQGFDTFDELAVMVVTDRHRYEQELLLARQKAENALAAREHAEAQLRHLNQQLSEADRRKDDFLATLAHELRNPLAPMRNVLEALRLKDLDDPQLRWFRDVFERQLQHMTHLVDDLLEISRITHGKFELRRRPIDLAGTLHGAVEAVTALAQASSHQLNVSLPREPITLNADPTRLSQVIQNLLNNAIKYTPTGGQIWLSAGRHREQAVISVRDSGIGIPSEHLSKVFEMFSQLAPALERSQGGLGIGLALVRGLVELHGGTVSAHSAGVGQGSEFTINLPLLEAHDATRPAVAAALDISGVSRDVLVVDDNRDAAESLAMVLELEGHRVRTAADGVSALQMADAWHPEVVILDIGLPEINGYEIARRIRTQAWGNEVMLVAVTGWGQAQDKQDAADAGFDHHFTKPVDPTGLCTLLNARTIPGEQT